MKKLLILLALLLLIIFPASSEKLEWSIDIVSPEYKIEPEFVIPAYNPAALAFLDQDSFYFLYHRCLHTPDDVDEWGGQTTQLVDGYYVKDFNKPGVVGYMVPLGSSFGVGVEWILVCYDRFLHTPFFFDYQGIPTQSIGGGPDTSGGTLSVGYRFLADMSLGLSVLAWYNQSRPSDDPSIAPLAESGANYSVVGGYMLRAFDQRFTFSCWFYCILRYNPV